MQTWPPAAWPRGARSVRGVSVTEERPAWAAVSKATVWCAALAAGSTGPRLRRQRPGRRVARSTAPAPPNGLVRKEENGVLPAGSGPEAEKHPRLTRAWGPQVPRFLEPTRLSLPVPVFLLPSRGFLGPLQGACPPGARPHGRGKENLTAQHGSRVLPLARSVSRSWAAALGAFAGSGSCRGGRAGARVSGKTSSRSKETGLEQDRRGLAKDRRGAEHTGQVSGLRAAKAGPASGVQQRTRGAAGARGAGAGGQRRGRSTPPSPRHSAAEGPWKSGDARRPPPWRTWLPPGTGRLRRQRKKLEGQQLLGLRETPGRRTRGPEKPCGLRVRGRTPHRVSEAL